MTSFFVAAICLYYKLIINWLVYTLNNAVFACLNYIHKYVAKQHQKQWIGGSVYMCCHLCCLLTVMSVRLSVRPSSIHTFESSLVICASSAAGIILHNYILGQLNFPLFTSANCGLDVCFKTKAKIFTIIIFLLQLFLTFLGRWVIFDRTFVVSFSCWITDYRTNMF